HSNIRVTPRLRASAWIYAPSGAGRLLSGFVLKNLLFSSVSGSAKSSVPESPEHWLRRQYSWTVERDKLSALAIWFLLRWPSKKSRRHSLIFRIDFLLVMVLLGARISLRSQG